MKKMVAVLLVFALVIPMCESAFGAKLTKEEKNALRAQKRQQKALRMVERVESKIAKEEAKHMKRVQKLEAVRDRLEGLGNVEAAANVQLAIEKENERHIRVTARLQLRLAAAQEDAGIVPE